MKRLIIILLVAIPLVFIVEIPLMMFIKGKSEMMKTDAIITSALSVFFIQLGLYLVAMVLALYQIGTSKTFTTTQKLLWMLLILFIHVIGLIIYLFLGEKMAKENQVTTTS